jgi:putative membrane protein
MSATENAESWRRLHPLTPLVRSVQLLYAVAIGALVFSSGKGTTLLFLLGITVAVAAWLTLSYFFYRYSVTDEGLVIRHGVLFRQRRVIPKSRIQNVDLRAGLLQQLLQVTTASIETAGGQGTEARLHVVSRAEGIRLRHALVTLPAGSSAPAVAIAPGQGPEHDGSVPATPDISYRRSGIGELVIAGATSNRAGVLVGVLFGGDFLFDFMPTDWILGRVLPPELLEPGSSATSLIESAQHDVRGFVLGAFLLTLFFGLAGWAVSIIASVVRHFNFTLKRVGGELQVSYGLFTKREKGFRRSRVQSVQIEEPILRRWLRLASLKVQTAGYGPGVKADERVEMLAPIAKRAQIDEYLETVYPDIAWKDVEWRPSHPRAVRRFFIRRAFVVLAATAAATLALGTPGLLFLVGLVPAWFLARAHYRHLGHARLGDYVLVREGLWTRRSYIVPVRKIQALYLKQTPFQRRLGLGTVWIETAGSPLEWHAPRSIDLGRDYGLDIMDGLAGEVRRTGLVF